MSRITKVSVPTCVQLDDRQKDLLSRWAKTVQVPEEYESDCCGSYAFDFRIFASGIRDTIIVSGFGKQLHLEYDDDGDLIGEGSF